MFIDESCDEGENMNSYFFRTRRMGLSILGLALLMGLGQTAFAQRVIDPRATTSSDPLQYPDKGKSKPSDLRKENVSNAAYETYFNSRDARKFCANFENTSPATQLPDAPANISALFDQFYGVRGVDVFHPQKIEMTPTHMRTPNLFRRLAKYGWIYSNQEGLNFFHSAKSFPQNNEEGDVTVDDLAQYIRPLDMVFVVPNYGSEHASFYVYPIEAVTNIKGKKTFTASGYHYDGLNGRNELSRLRPDAAGESVGHAGQPTQWNAQSINQQFGKKSDLEVLNNPDDTSSATHVAVFRPFILARWSKYDICDEDVKLESTDFCDSFWRKNFRRERGYDFSLCYHHCLEVRDDNKRIKCVETYNDAYTWSTESKKTKVIKLLNLINKANLSENPKAFKIKVLDYFLPQTINKNDMAISCMNAKGLKEDLCLHRISHRFFFKSQVK